MIPTVLDHVEQLTENIATFWFRPEKPVRYDAGQFTEVHLPHETTDERRDKRWFTLSSSPTEELLAITTKFTTPGSSFKCKLAALKPGDSVQLAEPMGDFVLPKDSSIPLVFVAAGIGITPVRSMLKYLADTNQRRTVQVIYRPANMHEVLFKDEIKAVCPAPIIPTARITPHIIYEACQPLLGRLVYISGPEQMIEELAPELVRLGMDSSRIVTDYFHGYDAV